VVLTVADRADLQRIAVAPDHQRAGIGSRLLAELVARCRAGGGSALLLEVAADNGPASAFYRRHGFVEVARRPRYYADGREAVVMRLDREPGRVLG
jgi:ribosomal-protein-alanine N-acetyltransferase